MILRKIPLRIMEWQVPKSGDDGKFIVSLINDGEMLGVFGLVGYDIYHESVVNAYGLNPKEVLGGANYSEGYKDGEIIFKEGSCDFGALPRELGEEIAKQLKVHPTFGRNIEGILFENFWCPEPKHEQKWRDLGYSIYKQIMHSQNP